MDGDENSPPTNIRQPILPTKSQKNIKQTSPANFAPKAPQEVYGPTTSSPQTHKRRPPGGVELTELQKREKLYKHKFIDRVNWLDRITFSRLEEIKQEVNIKAIKKRFIMFNKKIIACMHWNCSMHF